MNDLIKQTIMSQYANSPRLMKIIGDLTDAIDPSASMEDFYNIVLNLNTAQGIGLDYWGRIVGIRRQWTIPNPDDEFFGFADGYFPFNQRPFYSEGGTFTYELPDEKYKELILIKAMANILKATMPNINKLMLSVFKKKCYILITGHMRARYVFEFALSGFDKYLIYNTDILPRPCGVEIEAVDAIPPETFGFNGSGFQPFNQGTFYDR